MVHLGGKTADLEPVRDADAVIVVVGMAFKDGGESIVSTDAASAAVFRGIFKWKWVQRATMAAASVAYEPYASIEHPPVGGA